MVHISIFAIKHNTFSTFWGRKMYQILMKRWKTNSSETANCCDCFDQNIWKSVVF